MEREGEAAHPKLGACVSNFLASFHCCNAFPAEMWKNSWHVRSCCSNLMEMTFC